MNKETKRKILTVSGVSKQINGSRILSDVSLYIPAGEIVGLIGPNGAGKTTLLKILSGYLIPDEGDVYLSAEEKEKSVQHLTDQVSAVFGGSNGFYKKATVEENLLFFATLMGVKKTIRSQRVKNALAQVDLSQKADVLVANLSMGMLQRLHIARGLLKESRLLLLDEPTNGLDATSSLKVRALIRKIAEEGHSILITSHLLHEVSEIANKIYLLQDGQLTFEGTLEELTQASGLKRINRPATLEESYLAFLEKKGD